MLKSLRLSLLLLLYFPCSISSWECFNHTQFDWFNVFYFIHDSEKIISLKCWIICRDESSLQTPTKGGPPQNPTLTYFCCRSHVFFYVFSYLIFYSIWAILILGICILGFVEGDINIVHWTTFTLETILIVWRLWLLNLFLGDTFTIELSRNYP